MRRIRTKVEKTHNELLFTYGKTRYRVFAISLGTACVCLGACLPLENGLPRYLLMAGWVIGMLVAKFIVWTHLTKMHRRRMAQIKSSMRRTEVEFADRITTLSLPGYYREHGWRGEKF